MASLFSDSEKDGINDLLNDVHDTFRREIYAYIEQATTEPQNNNYNPLYGRTLNQARVTTNIVREKFAILARVFYPKPNDRERLKDMPTPSSELLCRVKITPDDLETLKKASVIEVDDENYKLDSDAKFIGPFDVTTNFVEVWLQKAS